MVYSQEALPPLVLCTSCCAEKDVFEMKVGCLNPFEKVIILVLRGEESNLHSYWIYLKKSQPTNKGDYMNSDETQ